MRDFRSDEAKQYRKLYKTAAWKRRRAAQLLAEPFCQFCLEIGQVTSANTADHITPHRGDLDLFWNGDLQSLCAECHATAKQAIEARGYSAACNKDGYPIDPNHPSNVDAEKRSKYET